MGIFLIDFGYGTAPDIAVPETLFVWQEHKSPAMSVNTSINEYDLFMILLFIIDYMLKKLLQGNVLHPFIPV